MRLAWLTLVIALPGYAESSCTRDVLQSVADSYIELQTEGSGPLRRPTVPVSAASRVLVAFRLGYSENFDTGGPRLFDSPLEISHHRSLIDTVTCETFTEAIGKDGEIPYAVGTRVSAHRNTVDEIEMMWSSLGYWDFDADRYLAAARAEDWSTIPAGQRDTRNTLESVANAYMDALLEGKANVEPWGRPCRRTAPDGTCQVGTPLPAANIANRHYVIDETLGAIAVLCTFGAPPQSGRIRTADVHLFRVEKGKIRYVHAITHLKADGR